ncbi:hypothetical protein Leryth_016191 [Lithospermum erythrorhizon]|nr:hypothetical protein Leryth_016191 [Lithospermum erythrorhizon]
MQSLIQKMAGSMLSTTNLPLPTTTTATTSESASFAMALTTVINQWEVEYARYVNYPPLNSLHSTPPHHLLIPQTSYFRKRYRSGAWLQTEDSGVFVRIIPDSSTASRVAVLVVYHRYTIFEEHYVSQLHFSWPQVTCISGFPARGTRCVLISYRDGENSDQIQKFAFRFSTTHEAEDFISALKETLEDTRPEASNSMLGSGVSSQQDFDPSNSRTIKSVDESWRSGFSLDSSSYFVPTTTYQEAAQASNGQELILCNEAEETISTFPPTFTSGPSLDSSSHYIPTTIDQETAQSSNGQALLLSNEAEEIISTFPPSFTSFLMNCCPTAEQGCNKVNKTRRGGFQRTDNEVYERSFLPRYLE